MKTKIYKPTNENLTLCASIIKSGEVVAFPTETVYGLGANAMKAESVKKIYSAKGRPSDNPLIVHIADKSTVFELASCVPDNAKAVMDAFMPGPVTIVLPKKPCVPDEVTGGLKTVAIRMPQNEIALKLIKEANCPVCAPSANTSSRPSPTTAKHVYEDLNGKITAILDGGECEVGVESTVIDFTTPVPRLLRAGGMAVEEIEKVVGKIEVVKDSKIALCPGMKYKHYSPTAEVYLAGTEREGKDIAQAYIGLTNEGKRTVIICLEQKVKEFSDFNIYIAGRTVKDYAHNLFALLRKADADGYDAVICEGVSEEGLGASVLNRLDKASGGKRV